MQFATLFATKLEDVSPKTWYVGKQILLCSLPKYTVYFLGQDICCCAFLFNFYSLFQVDLTKLILGKKLQKEPNLLCHVVVTAMLHLVKRNVNKYSSHSVVCKIMCHKTRICVAAKQHYLQHIPVEGWKQNRWSVPLIRHC